MGWSGIGKARKKPRGVLQEKTRRRIELAARIELQNLGYTDLQIAEHIGIKPSSFQRIKRLPLYRQIKSELFTGILSAASEKAYDNHKIQRDTIDRAITPAIQNLVDLATQRNDRRIQLAAIESLLDRQGRHTKVSRSSVVIEDVKAIAAEEDNAVVTELLAATKKKV